MSGRPATPSIAAASPPTSSPAAEESRDTVFEPNPHLRVSGMPPVPRALAERLARYTAFAATEFVGWHPTRRALLVACRAGDTTQLHLVEGPGRSPLQLTAGSEPVTEAAFEPVRGDVLVYSRDTGGNEAAQLHRLDCASGRSTLLTDPAMKHGTAVWNHAGDAIVFESLPLDRAPDPEAAETQGIPLATVLTIVEPMQPERRRTITRLPGGGWHTLRWSSDDRSVFAIEHRSVNDSAVWRIDVATGARERVLPAPRPSDDAAERLISFAGIDLTRDGRFLVYASDEDGEFRQLATLELATGARRALSGHIPWDVVDIALESAPAPGAGRACVVVNVAGRHELRLFDLDSGRELALPALPEAVRAGSVAHPRFARSGERDEIAFTVRSARSPGDVWTIALRPGATRAVEPWTRTQVPGVDTAGYREAEIVEWDGRDGLRLSGLLHRPPARFTGRRPVLIHIHGGPESQATIGFLGVNNYFVDELGIAYLQPNVRGSTGYGKSFVALDDGVKREDAVDDIGALFDWIATQPDLDPTRVLVAGRSYGGYMSLAVATNHAARIVASIAVVGISHFTTFLERTETYRRDLRRVEYGDERDPAMRAFFDRISPLSNATRIAKPLLVINGRNDPRVPYQEGEQIVAKVQANGVEVWHIVADDEGHHFAKKPNIDFVFYAQALFVQRHLMGV